MANMEQYVDWAGLRFYDQRIKNYILRNTVTHESQAQLRSDLEQLENLLTTLSDGFTADKQHIYEHIEECKRLSATKEELAAAFTDLEELIRASTGVDLSDYATVEFVESRLKDIVPLPDDVVTRDELESLASTIPSLEGLASEDYVDSKIASIPATDLSDYAKLTDIPDTSEFITEIPSEYVTADELNAKMSSVDFVTTTTVEKLVDEKIEKVVTDGVTVSSISYGTF